MTRETLTDSWVELLSPSLCALIVGSTREKVCDPVPLASKLFYRLDELDIFCVGPTTYMGLVLGDHPGQLDQQKRTFTKRWIERMNPTLPAGLVRPPRKTLCDGIPAGPCAG